LLCAQSRIDLNRADETDMNAAPGIGATLARNIIRHRESVGPFASTDALLAVGGIGAKKLRKLKAYVEVAPSLNVDGLQHVQTSGSLFHPRGAVAK